MMTSENHISEVVSADRVLVEVDRLWRIVRRGESNVLQVHAHSLFHGCLWEDYSGSVWSTIQKVNDKILQDLVDYVAGTTE